MCQLIRCVLNFKIGGFEVNGCTNDRRILACDVAYESERCAEGISSFTANKIIK